jgi:L-threonylcarbamoyladenylate synthase
MALILHAQRPEADAAIDDAVQRLRAGHLVALPTETVYGLAADADQPEAVARIFAAKGRPADHPLIVHLAGTTREEWAAALDHYAAQVPPFAQRLMEAFWPGPLTLILPRRPGVADTAAGGQPTIGLRCPAHPVAQRVLRVAQAAGIHGLAAPSANRFGRVSPTTAQHVLDELGHLDDEALLILDGGACPVGIESTIIDCSRGRPVRLRPGTIGRDELHAVAGVPIAERDAQAPRASGTLASHYAPRAKVRLMDATELQTALDLLGGEARQLAVYHRTPLRVLSPHVRMARMSDDAAACARELFAVLRALDADDTRLIWVERPPADAAWDGVRDRLQRAAA